MAPIANPASETVASAAPAPIVSTQNALAPDASAPRLRAPITSSQDAQQSSALDDTVTEARVAPGDLPTVADLAGSNTPTPPAATVADLPPQAATQTLQAPPASAASSQIYVQVGAFNDSHFAMQTYNQVLGFGKASVSPIVVNGHTVYRVRLGPVADADEASRITTKLKAHGHDGAKIVMQ
jgi:rare lipoprotein A